MENLSETEIEQMPLLDVVATDVVNALETVGDVVDMVAKPTIVITAWGANWIGRTWNLWRNGGPAGTYATELLNILDGVDEEPEELVETHIKEETKQVIVTKRDGNGNFVEDVVVEQKRCRMVKKLKKGKRSVFAASVAKQAYNKFGERPYSEANVLVTRKWLQKFFDDAKFTDLRTVDKNTAIDRALFLSFVPTREFQQGRIAMATRQWQGRMDATSSFKGFWTTVFGVGVVDPSTDDLC